LAAEQAITSKLLDITIDGARGILFNVTGGTGMTLYEVNTAAAIIKETAHPDVNLIFGAVIDDTLGDDLRITVIATGFDSAGLRTSLPRIESRKEPAVLGAAVQDLVQAVVKSNEPEMVTVNYEPRVVDSNNLDIPAFLRKHN
jgi:cell division protein FtsZ